MNGCDEKKVKDAFQEPIPLKARAKPRQEITEFAGEQ